MEFLSHLWLPILVSAAAVWFASALAWMAVGHHKEDSLPLPNEQEVIDTVKRWNLSPGEYMFPDFRRCKGMSKEEKKTMYENMQKNPMGLFRVWGKISMGGNMLWTFVVFLLASAMIGYLGWAALPHARDSFGHIFQVLGTAGILAYCFASFPNDIWFQRSKRAMAMCAIDGVVFGLITGAIFAWLWPTAALPGIGH
jgi:hypothetical protein